MLELDIDKIYFVECELCTARLDVDPELELCEFCKQRKREFESLKQEIRDLRAWRRDVVKGMCP